jgi:hypothetical protein
MDWKHLLAYITGTVDQELLLRNEYLDSIGFFIFPARVVPVGGLRTG